MTIVHFTPSVTHMRGSSARKTVLKKSRTCVFTQKLDCLSVGKKWRTLPTTPCLKTFIALHVIRPPNCDPREDVLLCSGEVSRPKRTHFQACLLHVFSGMYYTTSCVASAFAYEASGALNQEATPLQNTFGLTFTIFSAWYFLRVVRKRGNAAKKFRVANSLSVSLKK